jgi:hypothetical protein
MRYFISMMVLGVVACGDETDPTPDPDCTDCSSGTSNPFGTIRATATYLGDDQDCTVNIIGPESLSVDTNQEATVKAGDYEVTVGDLAVLTHDDLPIHVMDDGLETVAPLQEADIENETDAELTFALNVYLNHEFVCTRDEWAWVNDEWNEGDQNEDVNHGDPISLVVEDGYKVKNPDGQVFSASFDVEMNGDTFSGFSSVGDEIHSTILDIVNGEIVGFTLTYEAPEWSISYYSCVAI